MTTVAELIKYLETLPPDTIVETLKECDSRYYYSTHVKVVDLELPDENGWSDNIEFIDFTNNQFVEFDDMYCTKTYLRIGEIK